MRILLVNYRYFISGGPERYMFNIKELLEKNGHEVIPFSVQSSRNEYSEYEKYFAKPIDNGDAVYYDDVKKTPKTILRLMGRSIYSFEVKSAIKKVICEVKPDVVYIIHFINKLSPSVITGAKELGVPVVLRLSDFFLICPCCDFMHNRHICEDCLKYGYKSCIKNKCIKNSLAASFIRVLAMKTHKWMKVYDKVDAFITPSNYLRQKLISNGFDGKKIVCIPTFAKDTEIEDSSKTIIGDYGLYFGRISVEKGIETLIKAYKKMPDKNLVIMGDDSTSEAIRLKKYVGKKHLNNIDFIGFKSGNELEEVIQKARFVVIPSIWYDNLPNTALEAFKYSKPIIASNIGSLPEIVNDKVNGLLFSPGNIEDLADKIKMIENTEMLESLGHNSRHTYCNKYSEQKHYRRLTRLFEKVVKLKNGNSI